MPTFTRKYLKDKQGNYISTATLADMQYHSDGETTETKMQTIETTLGNGVLSTVAQNVVEGLNEVADEVIAARTDVNGTYNSLDARLDAMDVKISLASGGGGSIDLSSYQTKEDTSLQTNSKQVVGAINELNDDILVLEDYTGNQGTTNDLTTKVATLSTDVTTLQTEIEDSHTDVNGTVYGTIGQRLDNVENGYLPLAGGTVTGNLTINGTTRAAGNLGVTGKSYMDDDIILDNSKMLMGELASGGSRQIAYINTSDKVVIGAGDIPTIIDGSEITTSVGITVNGEAEVTEKIIGQTLELGKFDDTTYRSVMIKRLDSQSLGAYGVRFGPTANLSGADREKAAAIEIGKQNSAGTGMDNERRYLFGMSYLNVTENDKVSLGTPGNRWKDIYTNGITLGGLNDQSTKYATFRRLESDGTTTMGRLGITLTSNNNNQERTFSIDVGERMADGTYTTSRVYRFAENFFASASDNQVDLGRANNRFKTVYAANGTIQTSDSRYKSDIRDIDDNIFYNMVKNSGVHSYVLNYDNMPDNITQEEAPIEQIHVGIIAQELAQNEGWEYILVTNEREDGDIEYSVNNYNLTSAVMAALKVEITKREELEQENQELKEKVDDLQAKIEAIMTHVGL